MEATLDVALYSKHWSNMADFSDRHDHHLVRLAREYEDRGEKVSWPALASVMKYSKKDASALKRRLTTLKNTHGKLLRDFPRRFFYSQQPVGKFTSRSLHPVYILPNPSPPQLVASLPPPEFLPLPPQSLVNQNTPPSCALPGKTKPGFQVELLSPHEAPRVMAHIFAAITKSDVRQAAGRTEHNVGELSIDGVTSLIARCALHRDDTFLDIGSGVGNVVAQVALQSPARQAIGIELRRDVAAYGSDAILESTPRYARLAHAINTQGDVVELVKDCSAVAGTTVLYANNFVFTEEASQAVHRLCCLLSTLRMVALVSPVCPRHRRRCVTEFCLLWCEEDTKLYVQTEYRPEPVQVHLYTRRHP